ncbi:MAG: ribonuclease R [Deltaproteobacteria bacterium]|nr:MAG: ribonuclease R [Deltaproteobacteria bacterium]TMB37304.1 MAG: ribonuclease R [Deltaproteobacteria bacterium]
MSIDPEHLLSALRRARGKGLSLKQLSGQLRLGQSQRHPLRRALADLMKHGRASYDGHVYREVEGHDRADGDRRTASGETPRPQSRRAPAAMIEGARMHRDKGPAQGARKPGAEVTGVIHLKAEGYGFVSPLLGDGGREDDLFVPPQFTRGALDGDVVRARAIRGRDGRLAGEVLEVVERRRQLALGIYQAKGKAQWVIPHDRNLTGNIAVPRHPRARDGDMVKVRLHREIQGALQGEIISVLGDRGDPRFEILAAAYAEGFSDEFDPATLIAAQSVPDHVHPDEISGRRDLRHLPLVTIDGEDARDFDDAVHVSRTPGGYRLVVAIADVAHYVRPGGPLDREALRRATSVYFPGTVLPMLPERLSNGICSLNPDVDRLCTVCDLALDKSGTPLQADIYEAVMRSHARLTYTRVAEALAGDADPQLRPLLDDLKAAHELSKKLTRRRQLRGSIDFDLPEAKIVLDEQGRVAEIARRPRNDAHRLVEEFMLAANEAVARFFQVRGLPTVYRIHDQPDREKLDAFAALARSHGFDLPAGEELTPRVLNDFLKAVEGKPAQKALNSLLLRAMMQAQYSPDNIGHYGLAAPTYLHFTSPIRRYPDLMVHRLLKEHWVRGGRPLRDPEREEQEAYLAGVSAQCSDRERAAMKAERDVDNFYSALYMQDKVGEKFKAVVSGVADFGLFCELEEVFVEGLVPAESLGAGVELDKEMQRLIVGSSGRSYSIGDEIVVEVIAVDPARRRITLGLAEKGVAPAGQWLTPEDIVPSSTSRSKPRRQAPRAVAPSPRRPPRGSPPGRPPRRKGTRDGGR